MKQQHRHSGPAEETTVECYIKHDVLRCKNLITEMFDSHRGNQHSINYEFNAVALFKHQMSQSAQPIELKIYRQLADRYLLITRSDTDYTTTIQ